MIFIFIPELEISGLMSLSGWSWLVIKNGEMGPCSNDFY